MKDKTSSMVTVLNPQGQPYPNVTRLMPMAPRPDTLDGKTLYFVDVRFMGVYTFLKEMMDWFSRNMPRVKTVFRDKVGDYYKDDPDLWAEIRAEGDAMVMGVGH